MKNPKWILFISYLILGFSFPSCEEDLPDFSQDPRKAIEGEWDVNEFSQLFKKSSSGFYIATILLHPTDSSSIYIRNFYSVDGNVQAFLDGRNVSVPEQTVSGYTIKGYGLISIDRSKIEWSYTVDLHTGEKDNVTASYSRE